MQTETTELTYDVFISYAGPDQESANELCEKFENEGLRCWIAPVSYTHLTLPTTPYV